MSAIRARTYSLCDRLPRVFQIRELIDYFTDGDVPAKSYVPMRNKLRDILLTRIWY